MKILVLQGANMNWLGHRQPEIYGTTTASELDEMIRAHATARNVSVEIVYTNSEAEIIDRVYRAVSDGTDAIVTNPGSFCYNSCAIRDALGGVKLPRVEVHLSNQLARGIHSVTAAGVTGLVMGFGPDSYLLGLDAAIRLVERKAAG